MKVFKFLILAFLFNLGWAQNKLEFSTPIREVSIIVTQNGYFPRAISVHAGEKVRFFVTSTVDKPDCVVIQQHKLFLAAEKGKVSEKEVLFDEPGRFKFYCPSSKNTGHITVIEKIKPEKSEPARDIASDYTEGKPDYWLPKDY